MELLEAYRKCTEPANVFKQEYMADWNTTMPERFAEGVIQGDSCAISVPIAVKAVKHLTQEVRDPFRYDIRPRRITLEIDAILDTASFETFFLQLRLQTVAITLPDLKIEHAFVTEYNTESITSDASFYVSINLQAISIDYRNNR